MRCLFQPGHTPRISACLQLRYTGVKRAGRGWSASSAVGNEIRCRAKLEGFCHFIMHFCILHVAQVTEDNARDNSRLLEERTGYETRLHFGVADATRCNRFFEDHICMLLQAFSLQVIAVMILVYFSLL